METNKTVNEGRLAEVQRALERHPNVIVYYGKPNRAALESMADNLGLDGVLVMFADDPEYSEYT